MKTIKKYFDNLKQAERYQNRLNGKYDSVKLIDFPHFEENGFYCWSVK